MRRIGLLTGIVLLLATAGCCNKVKGHWHLKEMQPAAGYEGLTVSRVSFYPNHSFESVAVRDGRAIKSKGTWDYCCCRKELHLMTGEKVLTYRATHKCDDTLHLSKTSEQGHEITAIMCREDRCRPCKPCAQRCD